MLSLFRVLVRVIVCECACVRVHQIAVHCMTFEELRDLYVFVKKSSFSISFEKSKKKEQNRALLLTLAVTKTVSFKSRSGSRGQTVKNVRNLMY